LPLTLWHEVAHQPCKLLAIHRLGEDGVYNACAAGTRNWLGVGGWGGQKVEVGIHGISILSLMFSSRF
jgi:hypothetical protein